MLTHVYDDVTYVYDDVTYVYIQVPMPYANNLEQAAIPTADNIVSAARRACYRKAA